MKEKEEITYTITKPPISEINFYGGGEKNEWLIKISEKNGIQFNHEVFPNSDPHSFAAAFIEILELNYNVRFDRK